MSEFSNPFRPGAGHTPPYLAGRQTERDEFLRLLGQSTILENMVLTGLRGVGKTVLLDSFKPLAIKQGWMWVGTDLSESTSISEENMAIRLCTDLSTITSSVVIESKQYNQLGFVSDPETILHNLGYLELRDIYSQIPGLSLDKIKGVLELVWSTLSSNTESIKGIIFAYDEAQNLDNQSRKDQYPLSLLLDCFQSLQKKGLPLMLVLTGLPTLFPKLVEARTFSERMFRVVLLKSLNKDESEKAILKPIEDAECPLRLSDQSVDTICHMSGGYPYFIQFFCREVFDVFIQRMDKGKQASVPAVEIEQKLDADFFAGRWIRATDRQRDLLSVISKLKNSENEFTVQEIVEESRKTTDNPFSSSHVNQMLVALTTLGLVFKNRHGMYSFAIPLLGQFIKRQNPEIPHMKLNI